MHLEVVRIKRLRHCLRRDHEEALRDGLGVAPGEGWVGVGLGLGLGLGARVRVGTWAGAGARATVWVLAWHEMAPKDMPGKMKKLFTCE